MSDIQIENQETEPKRFVKLRIALGLLPDPHGRPSFLWLERWNAYIITIFVAFGIPALALSDIGWAKIVIAAVWFSAWYPFFVYFEGREIVGQMQGRGSLDAAQASKQMSSAQSPYWGAVAAFIFWVVALAVHVTLRLSREVDQADFANSVSSIVYSGLSTTPLRYGLIEWWLIVQMVWATRLNNKTFYNIITEFLKATPRAERSERRIP
ncbi:MAG: hypothetical protein KBD06_01685 [Candidatus Pacebacteria bacterium]|nr:hypothetical protein [Candidatus Paceibacterota bacterium]